MSLSVCVVMLLYLIHSYITMLLHVPLQQYGLGLTSLTSLSNLQPFWGWYKTILQLCTGTNLTIVLLHNSVKTSFFEPLNFLLTFYREKNQGNQKFQQLIKTEAYILKNMTASISPGFPRIKVHQTKKYIQWGMHQGLELSFYDQTIWPSQTKCCMVVENKCGRLL